jgi:chromate reductase
MKFIFLSGSFHQKSRSLAILENIERSFGGHEINTLRLESLPFYSEDLLLEKPNVVKEFLVEIASADGIVFCTPEYNHSVPAVLKMRLIGLQGQHLNPF